MATSICLPSPLATGATAAVRASTSHSARLARRLRSPHPLSRAAAGMDAFHVSSRDTEPLLHAPAAAAATHRRLRVRTHAQGAEDVSTGAGDGAAAAEADYSLAAIILPFVFPALGGLLFGYDIGATSGATISVHSAALSGTTWFGLSSVQLGLVASGSLYGALGGSILAYRIADFLGRRIELITAAGLYISGALVTGLAPNFAVLIIGRLLYGIGIGLAMHGAPLYIAETCPPQIRGTLISLKELFIVLGILFGYLVGSLEIDVVGGWRYMFGLSAPLAAIMAVGMWTLPPSPRWLLLRAVQGKSPVEDNKKKAIQALRRLKGRSASDKVLTDEVDSNLASIRAAYADQESEGSIFQVFEGASLKAFTIGGGLVLFQQITGQPSVLYYATSILQTAGFSAASDAAKVSILIGLFKFLMTGFAVFKVDDLGRRPLLIGGVSGIVSNFALYNYLFKLYGLQQKVRPSLLATYLNG